MIGNGEINLFLKSVISVFMIGMMLLSATSTSAQIAPLESEDCDPLGIECGGTSDNTSKAVSYIRTVVNVFLTLIAITAAVFIIIGGIMYITSSGNDEQVQKAKNLILYAIIGLIVVGLSAAIVNFVINAIG